MSGGVGDVEWDVMLLLALLLLLLGFGEWKDASMSRRVVLWGFDRMEMMTVMVMSESLLLLRLDDRTVCKVVGGEWVCVGCVCGCVCLPLLSFFFSFLYRRLCVKDVVR